MKRYRLLCDQLDLPPKLYPASLAFGFVGALACGFLQAVKEYEGYAVYSLPFLMAPFYVVLFSAKGSASEKLGKILVGCLLSFVIAFVPGGILGSFLGDRFHLITNGGQP